MESKEERDSVNTWELDSDNSDAERDSSNKSDIDETSDWNIIYANFLRRRFFFVFFAQPLQRTFFVWSRHLKALQLKWNLSIALRLGQ